MIFYFNFHLPKIPGLHVCEVSHAMINDINLNFDSLPTFRSIIFISNKTKIPPSVRIFIQQN
jgi:hypothetical protein